VPIDRGHRQPRANEKPVTALGSVTAFLRSHIVTAGRATGMAVRQYSETHYRKFVCTEI
jgi:hypothetical protein